MEQRVLNAFYSTVAGLPYDVLMRPVLTHREDIWPHLQVIPTHRVLEVGVGTGLNIRHSNSSSFFGVDIKARMLSKARQRAKDIRLVRSDGAMLPFRDCTFDRGVFIYALSGIPGNKRAFAEMERVVKPGGLIGVLDSDDCTDAPFLGCAQMSLPGLLWKSKGLRVEYHKSYPYMLSDVSLYVLRKR